MAHLSKNYDIWYLVFSYTLKNCCEFCKIDRKNTKQIKCLI